MNLSDTRLKNIELIRNIFEQGGVVSLTTLVQRTKLVQVSCLNCIKELIDEGAARELARQGSANRGRPIRRFEVIPNYRLTAEIVLECESLRCAFPTSLSYRVVNVLGEILTDGI